MSPRCGLVAEPIVDLNSTFLWDKKEAHRTEIIHRTLMYVCVT